MSSGIVGVGAEPERAAAPAGELGTLEDEEPWDAKLGILGATAVCEGLAPLTQPLRQTFTFTAQLCMHWFQSGPWDETLYW